MIVESIILEFYSKDNPIVKSFRMTLGGNEKDLNQFIQNYSRMFDDIESSNISIRVSLIKSRTTLKIAMLNGNPRDQKASSTLENVYKDFRRIIR